MLDKLSKSIDTTLDAAGLHDEDEKLLVTNLLQLELPEVLTDDKLMYRKLFRQSKLSNEEIQRKKKAKIFISAFEVFT